MGNRVTAEPATYLPQPEARMGLHLDLGMRTGYAVMVGWKHLIDYGMWDLHGGGQRYAMGQLYDHVNEILDAGEFDMIGVENAAFQKGYAREVWHNFMGVLKLLAQERGLDIGRAGVSKMKWYVTGDGQAGKQKMSTAINRIYETQIGDDNVTDAIAVGYTLFSIDANGKAISWVT